MVGEHGLRGAVRNLTMGVNLTRRLGRAEPRKGMRTPQARFSNIPLLNIKNIAKPNGDLPLYLRRPSSKALGFTTFLYDSRDVK